jgi:hypothetical protein
MAGFHYSLYNSHAHRGDAQQATSSDFDDVVDAVKIARDCDELLQPALL